MPVKRLFLFFIFLSMLSCSSNRNTLERITRESYGKVSEGKPVELFTLTNRNGMVVQITNYGGIINSLKVPDQHGEMLDVVWVIIPLKNISKEIPRSDAWLGDTATGLPEVNSPWMVWNIIWL
jgi:hypothetical protein